MNNIVALGCCLMCVYAPMVMLGMIERKPVVYEAEARVEVPEIVQIEERIVWTPERVEAEIRKVFPEQPDLMVKVARCESGLIPDAHNARTVDSGIYQLNDYYHGDTLEALGLDPFDVRDNLTYARMLYIESGLAPWSASRKCWQ